MVQTGVNPYAAAAAAAAQYPQNGEAAPLKPAEVGKETLAVGAPVVQAGPPFSPPAATPNGIEQQTVSIVSFFNFKEKSLENPGSRGRNEIFHDLAGERNDWGC